MIKLLEDINGIGVKGATLTLNPAMEAIQVSANRATYITPPNIGDAGVPVLATKGVTGGSGKLKAGEKEIRAIGIDASVFAGAQKWFGSVQNSKSFNDTGVFSGTTYPGYGGGLKIEAEAHFSAVRLAWVSRVPNAMTASFAVVAATETADTSVAATAFQPIVNGTTYNSLATTIQPYGYKQATWNGAATVDHPAANLAAQVKVSDRIPCSSVPRADGGSRPLLLIRGQRGGTTDGDFATYSNAGISAIRTPNTAARGRVLQLCTGTNLVSNLASNGSLGTVSYEIFPIFEYDVPALTVFGTGDSIFQAEGLSLTGVVTSWGWRGCADASTPQRPINWVNAGCSGKGFPEYWARTQELISAGVTPNVLIVEPMSLNDYNGNVLELAYRIEVGKARAKEVIKYARDNSIANVCYVGLLPWNTLSAANDNLRKAYNTWLANFATAAGAGYLDFSALGDGASPERWVVGYNNASDGIHENEVAIDAVMAPALTAYLNTIG